MAADDNWAYEEEDDKSDESELEVALKDDREEDDEVVIGQDGAYEDEPFVYDDDSPNLAHEFDEHPDGQRALKRICALVLKRKDIADESTTEYRERLAKDMEIFTGNLPPKDPRFRDMANAHLPFAFENTMRVHSRYMMELFGDFSYPVSFIPTSDHFRNVADAITTHFTWQLREDIKDFVRQADRGCMMLEMWGDATCHSYYDNETKRIRHEMLDKDTFMVPYHYVTTTNDYSDCPYVIKVLRRQRHELQAKRDVWFGVDRILKRKAADMDDDPEEFLRRSMGNVQGEEKVDEGDWADFKLFQYEGWDCGLLPNQDRDRYIQAIVCEDTLTVLSLRIHEEPDWKDRARYRQQQQELEAYRVEKAQYDAAVGMSERFAQRMMNGELPPPDVDIQPPPPPPVAPSWMVDPDDASEMPPLPKSSPIHMFSHGVLIEPMAGNLGLGFGRMQADYTRAGNTVFSQFIDSASGGNAWSIIKTSNVTFQEDFRFGPMVVNTVDNVTGDELKNSIMELKPPPANPQMLEVLQTLAGFAQSSMGSNEILSGKPGKSSETYRGWAGRYDAATKQLSYTAFRMSLFFKQIFRNQCRLNSIFLPEDEVMRVVDYRVIESKEIRVRRSDYERGYGLEIRPDLRFISEQQRIDEANELVMLPRAIPQLMANSAFMYEATVKLLKARKELELIRLLGAPPPPPPVFGMQPQMPGAPPGAGPAPQPNQGTPANPPPGNPPGSTEPGIPGPKTAPAPQVEGGEK